MFFLQVSIEESLSILNVQDITINGLLLAICWYFYSRQTKGDERVQELNNKLLEKSETSLKEVLEYKDILEDLNKYLKKCQD